MKVFVWEIPNSGFFRIVLWDGECTYWDEQMRPSVGYHVSQKRLQKPCRITKSKFTYVGEL